jgi:hypothetical protein
MKGSGQWSVQSDFILHAVHVFLKPPGYDFCII